MSTKGNCLKQTNKQSQLYSNLSMTYGRAQYSCRENGQQSCADILQVSHLPEMQVGIHRNSLNPEVKFPATVSLKNMKEKTDKPQYLITIFFYRKPFQPFFSEHFVSKSVSAQQRTEKAPNNPMPEGSPSIPLSFQAERAANWHCSWAGSGQWQCRSSSLQLPLLLLILTLKKEKKKKNKKREKITSK